VRCPYPGLAPFRPEEARWFFGRDQIVQAICERLDAKMREGGSLLVIGTSGAGKSSLLRAGVLPAIEQGKLPASGSGHWPQLVVTPSADPMMALATAVGAVTGEDPQELRDPRQCVRAFRQLPATGARHDPAAPARVVLVVDPLEDLFTACPDKQRRRQFIDVLDQLSAPGDGEDPAALVIVGLRADYYQALADYPRFWHALGAPVPVSPMSAAEFRDAIRLPAADVGLEIEDGLVEVLLADLGVGGDGAPGPLDGAAVGRLPLLAHALRTTWQQRHGNVLTVDGYRATGGIRHAIAATADRLFGSLSEPGQQVARTLFLRLVKIGDSTDDARRHVNRADLVRGLPDPDLAGQVADVFIRGRLLTQEQDTIAITHDALMRAWPQLSRWIAGDRRGHLIRQELDEAAASWESASREPAALYRGTRLDAARSWASTHPGDISRAAREFLAASRAQQRRGARLRRGAVAALAALALVATTSAVVAFRQNASAQSAARTAIEQRDQAIANEVVAEALQLRSADPSLAARLELAAYRMQPSADNASRLFSMENIPLATVVPVEKGRVDSVAFSPDGRTLVRGGSDGRIQAYALASGAAPVRAGGLVGTGASDVWALAFRPDGRVLATGNDASIRLWTMTSTGQIASLGQPITAHQKAVTAVAFSPDGHLLASVGGDGTTRLWNVSDPAHPRPAGQPLAGQTDVASSVAFGCSSLGGTV
jgi:energy-coupling factor transporter ATP-binding protein EcfA2